MPEWTEHVIWWQIYPLGFVGADTAAAESEDGSAGGDHTLTHRLDRLVPWLDYLVELGANGLALGPIFASRTHGYDTTDFFEIDPRLGDRADLDNLIAEAHTRGIRVMLDGVFNHVGRDFGPLRLAEADPAAPENALFVRDGTGELAVFEGHDALVGLDHSTPAVADYVTSVMTHWLDAGVDAWRLDAAYSVPNAFWADVLPRVRAAHPDVYVVGEVLHGDYASVVTEGTLDSVTQYELWQGVWHGIQEGNLFELDWALKRHNEFLDTFVPYTFVGNHDVTRIASQIDDDRHHPHAVVLLFTLAGTPSVYYGDEQGLRAVKEERFGGDDAIRPAYPAYEDSDAARGELPAAAAATLAMHQRLIGLRRRNPWLHRATSTPVSVENTAYVYTVTNGADRLVVALNIGDTALQVPAAAIGESGAGRGDGHPAEANVVEGAAERTATGFAVPPHGWAILG
jgi:cyclomaltodextrinase